MRKQKGFTLVELTTVLGIISVMMFAIMSLLFSFEEKYGKYNQSNIDQFNEEYGTSYHNYYDYSIPVYDYSSEYQMIIENSNP